MTPRQTTRGAWLAVVAVVAVSLNLRPGATVVGPLMAEILADLGQGSTWGGLLTAMPGLCFAAFGALAVGLAVRVGLNRALWLGAAVTAVGLLARAFVPDAAAFLAFTALGYAGIAVGNVLLPGFIKRRFPGHVAGMMTLYSCLLAVGATLASAAAVPLASVLPGQWRGSLAVWGGVAALAVVPMLAVALTEGSARVRGPRPERGPSLVRSRRAVALGIFFGVQSMQAYTQFGWAAQMYRDGGVDAADAGLLVSLIASFGIVTGLVMATVVERVRDLRGVVVALGVLLVVGYLGILYAPTTVPWLWAVSLGLSGAAFPMALALVTARSRDPHVTARLSAFGQSIGYALAALGPFAVGVIHGRTGSWTLPLWLLIGSAVVMVAAGLVASAPGDVDDDLSGVPGRAPGR
ncbi:MFS transporter [Propioniciclava soli]|uniref:MFS transporter n=1 Tax=Propioniciclava soli TaxID=2775081 RepID=UPI001E4D5AE0|nr:MFS transporter [Propioniciclava soli]